MAAKLATRMINSQFFFHGYDEINKSNLKGDYQLILNFHDFIQLVISFIIEKTKLQTIKNNLDRDYYLEKIDFEKDTY
jgi:hypothetical protein